jgi:hypothetical protein
MLKTCSNDFLSSPTIANPTRYDTNIKKSTLSAIINRLMRTAKFLIEWVSCNSGHLFFSCPRELTFEKCFRVVSYADFNVHPRLVGGSVQVGNCAFLLLNVNKLGNHSIA